MVLNRAIKMRIYPNDEQHHKIDVTLGYCRYVYNKMLERNTVIYRRRKEHLNYYAMQNLLPEMKKYLPWLKETQHLTDSSINREVIRNSTQNAENNLIRLRIQALFV